MITIEEQGATILITTTEHANSEAKIIRLNKDEYYDIKKGVTKRYDHSAENRQDNIKSLYRTMGRLRAIINANTERPELVLWVTFTYAENMTDADQLREDWDKAWKRYKYYFKEKGIEQPEYIIAAEPQARGAWHLHALLIFPTKRPYIPNGTMAKIWRHGFTKTKALKNSDNIAGYLCAYLCDIDLAEIDNTSEKAIIKGGRLYLYPKGFRLYRCSRGIARPKKRTATETEAKRIRRSGAIQTGKRVIDYQDPKTGYKTRIVKEWYKTDRKAGQNEQGKPAGRQDAKAARDDACEEAGNALEAHLRSHATGEGDSSHRSRNREP